MTGDDQSDPFLWDEDRVVQELCTENRSWNAPQPDRLPDPATLEAKLRDCGVDGQTLLTYGDEFGFDLLWRNLGIKKLLHHSSLLKAIKQLQGRSPSYRLLKTQQQADSQRHDGEDGGMSMELDLGNIIDLGLVHQPALASGTPLANGNGEATTVTRTATRTATPALTVPDQGVLSPALSPLANSDALAPTGRLGTPDLDRDVLEEPAAKRRRVAPTMLTTAPAPDENFAVVPIVPIEDDIILQDTVPTLPRALDSSGFLGTDAMPMHQLTDPQAVDSVQESEDEFAWTQSQVAPGRRLQVCRAMKRFLRSSRVHRLEASRDQDSEISLPLFGESDDEGYDSETWREIEEEEEEERLAQEASRTADGRFVGRDKVAETVNNVIQELEARWLVEKKPKWDHKAWKIWQDARRNPYRLKLIDLEKQLLAEVDGRVIRFSKELVDQQWSSQKEVRRMAAGFLEASVFDRKYQAWLIEVLQSPHQPPKPSTLPRPKRKVAKKPALDEDEELLTSDSDDMDAFVEYDDDDDGIPFGGDEMEIDSAQPLEQEIAPDGSTPGGLATLDDDETASGLSSARATPVDHQVHQDNTPLAQPTPMKVKAEQGMVPITLRRLNTSVFDPIVIDSPSPVKHLEQGAGLDDLNGLRTIGEIGVDFWEEAQDAKRLVVAVLCKWSHAELEKIYAAVKNHNHQQAWAKFMEPSIKDPASATAGSVELLLCLLFDAFFSTTAKRVQRSQLSRLTCSRLEADGRFFASFHAFLRRILPIFLPDVSQTPTRNVPRTTPTATPTGQSRVADDRNPSEDRSLSDEFGSDEAPAPSTKKRRRRRLRDKAAHDLRISNVNFTKELAQRASQFHENLASQGTVSGEQSRLIVNDTKESDEQGLIYINNHIGQRIKDHQIEGVRFMWNQVVVDSSVRQGCLLAHTMGLGKTMQVITLLVVIAEAAASPDESVRSQIPESLRESKTLILCPASLVDNWSEEISKWAPGESLGRVWRITSSLSSEQRVATLQRWASSGGIVIIGYPMFTNLINKKGGEQIVKILQETPNLVVGDEAHALKNPASQRHQAAAGFKTMNRIAMTGSPLTNNVMDYYAMINWVAPGYLADIAEFRQRFANPIKEGLYADSDPSSKRAARRMLHILKETVDPKVHRRDIQALVKDLPDKKEYIITLPLTKLQRRLYEIYIDWVRTNAERDQATAWSLVATLTRVLAHPFIFKTVAEAQKAKQSGKQAQTLKPTKRASPAEDLDEDVEAGEEMAEEKEEEEEVPTDILFRMLGEVAVREIEDHALSNKIFVLMRILDECKKKGDKVLIFSQSIATLDYLENTFKRQRVVYQRLDGKTRMAKRQEAVKNFNKHIGFGVYLISTTAGGVGLNIHGANRVVIFDFRYTPANEQQAVGRAYRLGQSKPVYVYRLTIGGTFEDTIHNNAVFKTQLASRLVDKKNPDPWSKRLSEYFVMPRVVEQEDLSESRGQDEVLDALLTSKDMEGLIRKITPTETFEKEETYEFTPEEDRENAEEIKLELLRLSNPEEFRRRELARAYRAVGIPPQPPSSWHPRAIDGESRGIDQITGTRSGRMIRIKVPEHLRDKSNPEPSVSAVASGAESAQRASQPSAEPPTQQLLTMTPGQATASSSSHYPVIPGLGTLASSQPLLLQAQAAFGQSVTGLKQVEANGAPVQELAAAVPQPILGSGSHFKETQVPSSANANRSSTLDGPSNTTSLTAAEDASSDFPELLRVHRKLCDEGRHVKYHPHDLISKVKGVLAANRVEELPWLDKMQNLKKCSRDERFSEAMLSGYLEPAQLAALTRAKMEQIATELGGMAEAEFKQKVWTTKADISNQARAEQQQQQSPAKMTIEEARRAAMLWAEVKREPGWRARRGLLPFITSPEPEDGGSRQVATPPPDRRRAVRPGDSAESPQIID